MALTRKLLPLFGATLAAGALAFAQDPVPTRVHADAIGGPSGTPVPYDVTLDLRVDPLAGPCLRISNAVFGAGAVMVLGFSSAVLPLPFDAQLLVDPVVTLAGIVGPSRSFAVPFALTVPAFVDHALYAQGFQFIESPLVFQGTQAVSLAFVAGNAQPPLFYKGPPLTVTPVMNRTRYDDGRLELFTSMVVPTSGYTLTLQSMATAQNITRLFLVLDAPNPDEYVLPIMETLRLNVDLGVRPAKVAQLLIEQSIRGAPTPQLFVLAAEVHNDF